MSTDLLVTPTQAWPILALCLTALILAVLFYQSHYLKEFITMTTQDAVDAVTAELVKVRGEVTAASEAQAAAIAALQEQLANIPGAEVVDLTALQDVAKSLDDLTPDPEPVPEPAPVEPPVEPAPEAPADPAA